MNEPDPVQALSNEIAKNQPIPGAPVSAVKFEWAKFGMGWMATSKAHEVRIVCRKMREHSGELHCELTIQTAAGLNMYRARVNLSAPRTRNELTKHLAQRYENDWMGIIERLAWDLPEKIREKDEVIVLDGSWAPTPTSYLMNPMLEDREPTILFAPGGAGKSTFAAAIAASVASGIEIVPGWRVNYAANVMVLDWEGSRDIWWERVKKIRAGMGEVTPEMTIHYRGVTAGSLEDIIEEVAEDCDAKAIGMLIVDSVGLAAGASGERGGMEDTALRLFQALRYVNKAALLIDHVNAESLKGNQPGLKMYGSIYKMNLARNVFELRRQKDPQTDEAEFIVHHTKVNHAARLRPQRLMVRYGTDQITFHRSDIHDVDLRASLPVRERMVEALRYGPLTTKMLAEEIEANEGTVRQELSRQNDLFGRTDDGRICLLTQMEFEGGN